MLRNRISLCLMLVALAPMLPCCSSTSERQPSITQPKPVPPKTLSTVVRLAERFITPSVEVDNVDSIAIYHGDEQSLAIVTAKGTHKLSVFDAETGKKIRDVGQPGDGPGQFQRPNGILVLKDWCMVVERDNHRIQILRLPDFTFAGFAGAEALQRPYGITAAMDPGGQSATLFITDDYKAPEGVTPEPDFFQERIKKFHVDFQQDTVASRCVKSFGDGEGPGRLTKVESILFDPALDRLYVAVEKGPTKGIVVYTSEGVFSHTLETPDIKGEPEGMGIYASEEDGGFLVITDQRPSVSLFHLFDRRTLRHVGCFKGDVTANTDGIAVDSTPMRTFSQGGLWAIHDDQSLAAFDWSGIGDALHLNSMRLELQPGTTSP